MSKTRKNKSQSGFDPSQPETLRGLGEDTLIGLITRLIEQNRQLSEILQSMLQEKHGQKTEKFIDSNQLRLFTDNTEQEQAVSSEISSGADANTDETPPPPKKRRARNHNPKPSNLPRVKVSVNQPAERICNCGLEKCKINERLLHSRQHYKPASIFIEEIVEEIFACPECDRAVIADAETAGTIDDEYAEPITNILAPELAELLKPGKTNPTNEEVINTAIESAAARIAKCGASPSLLAHVAVSKYCDHLPLYRLEEIYGRQGANIPRSTMCGWLNLVADILRALYNYMHEKLLDSKVIKTDDTPVKVLMHKAKKKIKLGRMWVYIGDKEHPFVLFHYTHGRGREGPKYFLKGYRRYLEGDCFSGNLAICAENGAVFVACNVHGRRYFKKAVLNYKVKSEEALRIYQRLFEIEKTAKELNLSSEDIKLMREQEAKPILDEFKTWLDKEQTMALPKSSFGKAVNYCINNWQHLTEYLSDGDLSIDNNIAEQEMKRIAMGRKAWLFFGSDNGGENAEVLFSIIATCKKHKVDPYTYLTDVIEQMMRNPDCDLEQLLPHVWKTAGITTSRLPQNSLHRDPAPAAPAPVSLSRISA